MSRCAQRGGARVSSLIALAVLIAVGWAAWNVVPVYIDHYDFADKVKEICRTPKYKIRGDQNQALTDMLMKEVRERRLGDWIAPESFEITTNEGSRQIHLYYERETQVLPGYKHTFRFDYTADEPLI